ncbi:universal stress protein, partial [Cellulomonas composti]|uniref:universal stress protein n=1 Tax=Cellulomonas composti TaxID=266130 RepID=UPI0011BFA242
MDPTARTPHDDRPWLVVGDDRTESSTFVWGWVAAQPWDGWRVTAVTARPPEVGVVPPDRSAPHAWQPAPLRVLPGRDGGVEHLLAEADPRAVLDSFGAADLLVVGHRGPGLLKRLHLGSTAEWLVSAHRPLGPVAVVRSTRPVREVLVCSDGSPSVLGAVDALAALPLVRGARVTVLGVDTLHADAQDGVRTVAARLEAVGAADVQTLLVGSVPMSAAFDVRPTILGTIDRLEPDLVVVGTRGLGGL